MDHGGSVRGNGKGREEREGGGKVGGEGRVNGRK